MKASRQDAILELVEKYEIETQDDLIERLRQSGFEVTQATVSRDIRELKIAKMTTGRGTYRYVLPKHIGENSAGIKFNKTGSPTHDRHLTGREQLHLRNGSGGQYVLITQSERIEAFVVQKRSAHSLDGYGRSVRCAVYRFKRADACVSAFVMYCKAHNFTYRNIFLFPFWEAFL